MSAKHAASRVVGEVVCARSGQKGAAVLRLFFHISVEAAGGSSTAWATLMAVCLREYMVSICFCACKRKQNVA